ncbi:DUF7657 domain-containing protein [Agromyces mariniharenae]|uniref:Glycosyltransferase RgtA/B/C/D-like domain-containing protein n=1 Tax=Agromyces mariniharenae TaxID=2604423 RepID=A0A5S4V070_9MICO|nr:hypothetical protein [Agromyces mariniharenae]TYL52517.1 hypothetical protein FYC51_01790 [Agromyces mariniharenae]
MLLWPLALLAIVLVVFVSLGLTGSSTGVLRPSFDTGADPDLLANQPLPIRSDEWYVQTSWTISQVEQGLPIENRSFPGGMDATVQHDLPSWDWSMVFRPHLLGFWFLPLDQAMALKWWLPGFALIAAVYVLAVTLLPRRPLTAALFGVGFFFAPFFQWWYLSITFFPAVWAALVMAAVIWMLRRPRGPARWVLAAIVAYVTVTVGTGIYVPFIVPAVYVVAAFAIGATLTASTTPLVGVVPRLRALVPLLIAGAAGALVMVLWLVTRWQTIEVFTGTVYPGERLESTGAGGFDQLKSLLSGPFQRNLELSDGAPFGTNQSEASSFLLPGLFLVIPLVWLFVRSVRERQRDWLALGLLVVGVVFAAFMLIPGWDAISHLLLLDRTTVGRLRLGWGLLSLIMMLFVLWRVDRRRTTAAARMPWWVVLSAVVPAAAWTAYIAWSLVRNNAVIATGDYTWILLAIGFVAIVACNAYGWALVTAVLFAAISIASSSSVNPLYRGVFDLNETQTVQTMKEISGDGSERWVGVGETSLPTVMLVQSGLPSFNGFQSSPSQEMWDAIDPDLDERVWNRLANVSWGPGDGPPDARNPAPDQIRLTFDSCASFAQENVEWVLADESLDQRCLEPVTTIDEGPSTFWIYEVVEQR